MDDSRDHVPQTLWLGFVQTISYQCTDSGFFALLCSMCCCGSHLLSVLIQHAAYTEECIYWSATYYT